MGPGTRAQGWGRPARQGLCGKVSVLLWLCTRRAGQVGIQKEGGQNPEAKHFLFHLLWICSLTHVCHHCKWTPASEMRVSVTNTGFPPGHVCPAGGMGWGSFG